MRVTVECPTCREEVDVNAKGNLPCPNCGSNIVVVPGIIEAGGPQEFCAGSSDARDVIQRGKGDG